jgi:hypothetical protein
MEHSWGASWPKVTILGNCGPHLYTQNKSDFKINFENYNKIHSDKNIA